MKTKEKRRVRAVVTAINGGFLFAAGDRVKIIRNNKTPGQPGYDAIGNYDHYDKFIGSIAIVTREMRMNSMETMRMYKLSVYGENPSYWWGEYCLEFAEDADENASKSAPSDSSTDGRAA